MDGWMDGWMGLDGYVVGIRAVHGRTSNPFSSFQYTTNDNDPPKTKHSKKKAYDNPAETLQRIKRQLLVTRHFKEVRGLTRWMMRRMTE